MSFGLILAFGRLVKELVAYPTTNVGWVTAIALFIGLKWAWPHIQPQLTKLAWAVAFFAIFIACNNILQRHTIQEWIGTHGSPLVWQAIEGVVTQLEGTDRPRWLSIAPSREEEDQNDAAPEPGRRHGR